MHVTLLRYPNIRKCITDLVVMVSNGQAYENEEKESVLAHLWSQQDDIRGTLQQIFEAYETGTVISTVVTLSFCQ